jgi:hypothetical protein
MEDGYYRMGEEAFPQMGTLMKPPYSSYCNGMAP